MKKVLFLCLGNICRSPAAEAIMKKKVAGMRKEEEFLIDSAGTYGGHSGDLPDARMREHAAKRGYVLDSRARRFYASADFADFDVIVGMDDRNVEDLRRLAVTEEEKNKIFKMTDFCVNHKGYSTIPDPYYGGSAGFELVLDLLEDAVSGLMIWINKKE